MQDSTVKTQQNNVEVGSSVSIESVLHALPKELLGVMPESVWATLSLEQKKDVLKQNGLLEKYSNTPEKPAEDVQVAVESAPKPEAQVGVVVQQEKKDEYVRDPEFQKMAEDIRKEQELPAQQLDADEKEMVKVESGTSSNVKSGGVKFFGYSASDDVSSNASDISQNGSVEDGKTWTATLIQKILAVFG